MGHLLISCSKLVAGRFFRVEPRLRARAYVRGLLAPLASKNGWTLAVAPGPEPGSGSGLRVVHGDPASTSCGFEG
jgi:hypothetical protein